MTAEQQAKLDSRLAVDAAMQRQYEAGKAADEAFQSDDVDSSALEAAAKEARIEYAKLSDAHHEKYG